VLSPHQVGANPDCTCRYLGQEFGLNQCVCMITPNGMRRACCGLVLNNTSWTFFKDGCVIAGSNQERHPRSERPATALLPSPKVSDES
tara:strand:+ start:2986 stop:3249 length:264 start_codon:yes stop_codon:yes gene_type:complete